MLHSLEIYAAILAATWLAVFVFCLIVKATPKKFGPREAALFATIQTVAGPPWAPLVVAGIFICLPLAYFRVTKADSNGVLHWRPRWAWLWDNLEDGVHPGWYAAQFPNWGDWKITFVWTAKRNPVNNLRFVPGISKVGRPLWRKTWGEKPGGWYLMAGWNSSGYPVMSGGRNVNSY